VLSLQIWTLFMLFFTLQSNVVDLNEEITFEAIESGNFAIIDLNEEEFFIINTGSQSSELEVMERIEQLNDKEIKGILITRPTEENCGNLNQIMQTYDVETVYLPFNMSESCIVDFTLSNVERLNDGDSIAIGANYYVEYTFNEEADVGNVILINDKFIIYWYEGLADYSKWEKNINALYIPENIPIEHITMEDLSKLDPEIAIINQRNKHIRSFINMFQEAWVDLYLLKRGTSVHIFFDQDRYYHIQLKKNGRK